MNIERHHLIEAIDNAVKKLSMAAMGKYTVPTPTIWEIIGDLELTSRLAKVERDKGGSNGDEERSEDEHA